MSDELNLFLISSNPFTPHKIEAGIAVIVVILIIIGVVIYMRRRGATSA